MSILHIQISTKYFSYIRIINNMRTRPIEVRIFFRLRLGHSRPVRLGNRCPAAVGTRHKCPCRCPNAAHTVRASVALLSMHNAGMTWFVDAAMQRCRYSGECRPWACWMSSVTGCIQIGGGEARARANVECYRLDCSTKNHHHRNMSDFG